MDTIVIKSVRACNLRCPYCYYINNDTKEYGKVISIETLECLFLKVRDYLCETNKKDFAFVWHGGEPLMLGIKKMTTILDLQARILDGYNIANLLQTNGVLINEKWIDFFKLYDVKIGISLDGDKESHDLMRSTINGKGTFEKIKSNLKLLNEAEIEFGLLCVINGKFDPEKILETFVDLNVSFCDFLIPMTNNALQKLNSNFVNIQEMTDFLSKCFDLWVSKYSSKIDIRMFHYMIYNAFGLDHGYLNAGNGNITDSLICETDGKICLDVEFSLIDRFSLGEEYVLGEANIFNSSFKFSNFLDNLEHTYKTKLSFENNSACQKCTMRSICRGSHPCSRYDEDHSFNNRSAYCDSMFHLSNQILNFIRKENLTESLIDSDLKELLYA